MKSRNCQLALLAIPLFAACSDTTGPNRLVTITPATQSVILETGPSGKVLHTSVTVTNASAFPVTIAPQCGIALEKKISGFIALASDGPTPPWYTVWVSICGYLANAVAIIPTPLLPGQSVSVPIVIPVTQPGTLNFDGSPGEYRVHLLLTTQILNDSRVVPHDLSVSDSFTVLAQ